MRTIFVEIAVAYIIEQLKEIKKQSEKDDKSYTNKLRTLANVGRITPLSQSKRDIIEEYITLFNKFNSLKNDNSLKDDLESKEKLRTHLSDCQEAGRYEGEKHKISNEGKFGKALEEISNFIENFYRILRTCGACLLLNFNSRDKKNLPSFKEIEAELLGMDAVILFNEQLYYVDFYAQGIIKIPNNIKEYQYLKDQFYVKFRVADKEALTLINKLIGRVQWDLLNILNENQPFNILCYYMASYYAYRMNDSKNPKLKNSQILSDGLAISRQVLVKKVLVPGQKDIASSNQNVSNYEAMIKQKVIRMNEDLDLFNQHLTIKCGLKWDVPISISILTMNVRMPDFSTGELHICTAKAGVEIKNTKVAILNRMPLSNDEEDLEGEKPNSKQKHSNNNYINNTRAIENNLEETENNNNYVQNNNIINKSSQNNNRPIYPQSNSVFNAKPIKKELPKKTSTSSNVQPPVKRTSTIPQNYQNNQPKHTNTVPQYNYPTSNNFLEELPEYNEENLYTEDQHETNDYLDSDDDGQQFMGGF